MHRLALVVAAVASLCYGHQQLEHITGTQRPMQLFINNRLLAVRPNGTIEGTHDASSPDTVLQRVAADKNRIILRNTVTCMHVCLDRCGFMYASATLSKDCFLNEVFTQNNYNVMFKIYDHKITYVALDHRGNPRRVQLPKSRDLRNMSKYTLIMKMPLYYNVVTQCPKQEKMVKHRKCRLV